MTNNISKDQILKCNFSREIFVNQQLTAKGTTWELIVPKIVAAEKETGNEDDNGITHFENNSTSSNSYAKSKALKNMESILVGIMQKDTIFSIGGGHMFGAGMPQIVPLIDTFRNLQEEAKKKYPIYAGDVNRLEKVAQELGNGSTIGEIAGKLNEIARFTGRQLNKAVSWALDGAFGLQANDLMNGQFITAFDFSKIYNGSNGYISLPNLKTRIFFDGVTSVAERVKTINKYLINGMKDTAGLFGMQVAPMGYMASLNELDPEDITRGSVSLRIGDSMYVHNLLVTGFDYTFSAQKVKSKTGLGGPLYADVTINLEPIGYVSRKKMEILLDQLNSNNINLRNS